MRFFVTGSITLALLLGGGLLSPLGSASAQTNDEWEENTRYYEDDAWYDISEWFDGNDYNPTDEQAFDWDDETYQSSDDTGADQNNDVDYDYDYDYGYDYDYDYDYDADYTDDYDYVYDPIENEYQWRYDPYDYYDYDTSTDWFGYDNQSGDDNWFYDYYDDGYAYYRDWDDDGIFEDLNCFSFDESNSSSSDQQSQSNAQATAQAEQRSSSDATSHSISGSVSQTKRVSLPTARHLVVSLEKNNGSMQTVDLGPVSALDDLDISQGDQITVRGPVLKVGDKPLLLAQQVEMNGQSKRIQRNRRKFSGEVADTRRMTVRGDEQHQLVILSNGDNKKRLVDLGPAGRLNLDLQQGDRVSVRGTPAKFQDKQIVFATSITLNGETTQIDRRQRSSDQQQTSHTAGSSQRQNQQAQRQNEQAQRQNQQAQRENQQAQRQNAQSQQARRGQQEGWTGAGQTQRSEQRRSSSQQVRQERRVSGEVQSTRTVSLRGKQRKMATIRTQNGDQIAIDLGPADRLRADLQDGDQVTALGIPVRADGQRVLVARQLQTNGQTIQIGRMRSQSTEGGQNQQAQGRTQRSVSGEVMSTRTVSVRGQQRKLAKIETREGMQIIVDMGPTAALRGFDLAEGDQLNARGLPLKVRDQNILVAMQVRSGDQSVRVDRRTQGDQAQGNQTQTR